MSDRAQTSRPASRLGKITRDWGALTFFVMCALVSAFLLIRPLTDIGERFIGHADRASMAMLARNIAEGRGAVIDCVWILHEGGMPWTDVSHPEGYWSLYVAYILSLLFRLFGAGLESVLLSGVIVKTAVAVLGAWWVKRFTRSQLASLAAGLFLLLDFSMIRLIDGLSDIYLTLFSFAGATTLIFAMTRNSTFLFFAAGALVGLAAGMKPTGASLACLAAVYAFMGRSKTVVLRNYALFALGIALGVLPLARHNLSAFGTVVSPQVKLMASATDRLFLEAGNHEVSQYFHAGFADPSPFRLSEEESRLLAREKRKRFLSEWSRAVMRGILVPLWMIPFVFLWFYKKTADFVRHSEDRGGPEMLFVIFAAILLLVGILVATWMHFEARYWNFLVPLMTVIAFAGMVRISRYLPLLALVLVVYQAVPNHLAWGEYKLQPLPAGYGRARELLPEDAVAFTAYPWQVSYHTRVKSVILPFTEDLEAVRAVARRYGVTHLVITNMDARRSYADDLRSGFFPAYVVDLVARGVFPPYLEKIHYSEELIIGRFRKSWLTSTGGSTRPGANRPPG